MSREELAKIHNCANLYIQYSIAGALEMPICEAKACHVPVLAVDYAAMSEQVETEGCEKIKVKKTFHEAVIETEQVRALPDSDDCVEKIHKFLQSSPEDKEKWGNLARKDTEENYSFDRAAKIFEKAIDETEVPDHKDTWLNASKGIEKINNNPPEKCSNLEFVDWCIDEVLHNPKLKESYWKSCILKDLGMGYCSVPQRLKTKISGRTRESRVLKQKKKMTFIHGGSYDGTDKFCVLATRIFRAIKVQ